MESIKEDIHWLGADWEDRLFFASDYFDQMYEAAVKLIKKARLLSAISLLMKSASIAELLQSPVKRALTVTVL